MQVEGWYDDDNYMMLLWRFGGSSPRHVAFVMTNVFLPGTRERLMAGYLELEPVTKN